MNAQSSPLIMPLYEAPTILDEDHAVAWTEPKYTRERVNAAAKIVMAAESPASEHWGYVEWDDYEIATGIVNNWRGSHSYPLNTFQMNLRNTAGKFDGSALVAQRTKRLRSIVHKLERFSEMKLTQMQDLGGCRAILSNVNAVQRVADYYENESSIKHVLATKDDYLAAPKTSGYRGVHLVYRYFSDKPAKQVYNDLKIEIQLRSTYQHAWATAVETVGMFSGQALKSSLGSAKWQRFFALMGSVIAMRERGALVPGTPQDRKQLRGELLALARELKVGDRLQEYGRALRHLHLYVGHYFLLQLNPSKGELTVSSFAANEIVIAQQRYTDAEDLVRKNPGTDAVLVSVDDVNALQRAYPNYFADTRIFVQLMNQALTGQVRPISLASQSRTRKVK